MAKFVLTFNSEAENFEELLTNIELVKTAVETAKKMYMTTDTMKHIENIAAASWTAPSKMPSNLKVKYTEK